MMMSAERGNEGKRRRDVPCNLRHVPSPPGFAKRIDSLLPAPLRSHPLTLPSTLPGRGNISPPPKDRRISSPPFSGDWEWMPDKQLDRPLANPVALPAGIPECQPKD